MSALAEGLTEVIKAHTMDLGGIILHRDLETDKITGYDLSCTCGNFTYPPDPNPEIDHLADHVGRVLESMLLGTAMAGDTEMFERA